MLASFQIPNRFFPAEGAATDMAGADWASQWGEVHAVRQGGGAIGPRGG
jgi:hypothetical protein